MSSQGPINEQHIAETVLVVVDVTAADEDTIRAVVHCLHQQSATSGITHLVLDSLRVLRCLLDDRVKAVGADVLLGLRHPGPAVGSRLGGHEGVVLGHRRAAPPRLSASHHPARLLSSVDGEFFAVRMGSGADAADVASARCGAELAAGTPEEVPGRVR